MLGQQIKNLDPQEVLKRGYSITLRNGEPIETSVSDEKPLEIGDTLTTLTSQIKIESTITKIESSNDDIASFLEVS